MNTKLINQLDPVTYSHEYQLGFWVPVQKGGNDGDTYRMSLNSMSENMVLSHNSLSNKNGDPDYMHISTARLNGINSLFLLPNGALPLIAGGLSEDSGLRVSKNIGGSTSYIKFKEQSSGLTFNDSESSINSPRGTSALYLHNNSAAINVGEYTVFHSSVYGGSIGHVTLTHPYTGSTVFNAGNSGVVIYKPNGSPALNAEDLSVSLLGGESSHDPKLIVTPSSAKIDYDSLGSVLVNSLGVEISSNSTMAKFMNGELNLGSDLIGSPNKKIVMNANGIDILNGASQYLKFGPKVQLAHGEGSSIELDSNKITIKGSNYTHIGEGSANLYLGQHSDFISIGDLASNIDIGNNSSSVYIGQESPSLYLGENSDSMWVGHSSKVLSIGQSSNLVEIGKESTVYIGQDCPNLSLGLFGSNIEIGAGSSGLEIGKNSSFVTVGEESSLVDIGGSATGVDIGYSSESIKIGQEADHIHIGENSSSITIGKDCNDLNVPSFSVKIGEDPDGGSPSGRTEINSNYVNIGYSNLDYPGVTSSKVGITASTVDIDTPMFEVGEDTDRYDMIEFVYVRVYNASENKYSMRPLSKSEFKDWLNWGV